MPKFAQSVGVVSKKVIPSSSVSEAASESGGLFHHRVWSLDDGVMSTLRTLPSDTYKIADDKLDATILVTEGVDWNKQTQQGPSSFLCRVLGKVHAHIDYIQNPKSVCRPLNWQPLSAKSTRSFAWKIYISAACRDKRKTLTRELEWLTGFSPYPVYARYKFEIIGTSGDDASQLLDRIKAANTLAGTRGFRWLVTRDEIETATFAVAAVLAIAPNAVKLVVSATNFIVSLGAAHQD